MGINEPPNYRRLSIIEVGCGSCINVTHVEQAEMYCELYKHRVWLNTICDNQKHKEDIKE